jgi:flagellar protein FlbT
MSLKIELKPHEKVIIGDSVITACDQRVSFLVDGNAPILRERDILTAETATTPVKRLHLCVQLMYLENDIGKYQDLYFEFVRDLIEAVPRFREPIAEVSNLILEGSFYKALRELKKLGAQERELLDHV